MGIEFVPATNVFVPQITAPMAGIPWRIQSATARSRTIAANDRSVPRRPPLHIVGGRAEARSFVPVPDRLVTSRDKFFTYFIRKFWLRLSSPQCCGDLRQGWT